MIKQVYMLIIVFIWTLLCIYGTYDNTVKSAEICTIDGGYEVIYHNTGDIFTYEVDNVRQMK